MEQENLTIPEGLDPQVVNLARAIRKQESGGNYEKSGDGGSSLGAYQWNNQPNGKSIPLQKGELPSNFTAWAKEAGLDPTDFSPKNQDMVAYNKIKKLKDAGNNVVDISAIWNGGDKNRQDPNYITPSGLPSQKKGVYDVPAYAKAVNDYYQQLKEKSVSQGTSKRKTFAESVSAIPPTLEQPSNGDTTAPGTFLQNLGQGKFGDAVQSGIRDVGSALTFGGSEQLGKQVGTGLAAIPAATKDLLIGSNDSQFHDQPSMGETVKGAAKTVGGIGLLASSSLLGGLGKGGSALESTVAKRAITDYGVGTMDSIGKANAISDALLDATQGEKVILQKALTELGPNILKEAGIGSFSELNPAIAKTLGLGAKTIKFLLRTGLDIAGLKGLSKLEGLIK